MKTFVVLSVLLPLSLSRPICDISSFGAAGDGATLDDQAMRAALAACAGGGQVFVPQGTYLLSPFNLTSNMELYLDRGSTLLASTNFSSWPVVESLPSYPPDEVTLPRADFRCVL